MLIVKSYGKLPVESQTNVPHLRISLDRCQEICLNTFWGVGGRFTFLHLYILLTVIKRYLIVPQAEAVFYVPLRPSFCGTLETYRCMKAPKTFLFYSFIVREVSGLSPVLLSFIF